MVTKNDIPKKAMLEALSKSLGNISTASKMVGIARTTHYKWLQEDPDYKSEFEELADQALDFVESKLFELIEGASRQVVTSEGIKTIKEPPNTAAVIFYLKTKGKKRGYIERSSMDKYELQPIQILISDKI